MTRILLDTHYVIRMLDDLSAGMAEPGYLEEAMEEGELIASMTSVWEADIKFRIGRLPLKNGVAAWPSMLERADVELLPITEAHVLAHIGPEPGHKDPFDRLLLCVAAAERCTLLTDDRVLRNHPLAWKPRFYR